MFNKSERVVIAKCKSTPAFAAAAYLIFKEEKGNAVDVIRAFEIIQDEKYQVENPKTKKKEDRLRTVRKFAFFIDSYFFFVPNSASYQSANFEMVRTLDPAEDIYTNYLRECAKAKEQLVIEREQARISQGPMNV